ncbi:glycosyltransferase [Herbaspirillum seropedicae]|uniref:glycosyltransferase n=1 Tax=Herbaspirillum seropedicae TaxID=964 RepID=UPI003F8D3181
MGNTLFIHAVNIHQGGGERLLKALLGAIDPRARTVLNVDRRMPLPATIPTGLEVRRVNRSVMARLWAELWLYRHAAQGDSILCFGNLPPLLPVKAFVSVFVQNRYLIDNVGLKSLKPWPRLRIKLERMWLRFGIKNASQFVVQTPSMQRLMQALAKDTQPVLIAPFAESVAESVSESFQSSVPPAAERLPNFLYVASGEDHKNHRRLIQAWQLLAAEGIRPSLVLTVDATNFPDLCAWIDGQTALHTLKVSNLGTVDAAAVAGLYEQADALVYPSQLESFGLPLIEASAAGLDLIAAELDYVRDVAAPAHSFDPTSAVSIARAIKRYCGYPAPALQLLTPAQFLRLSLRRAA